MGDRDVLERLSEPQVFGPGGWFFMHRLAAKVSNKEEMLRFIEVIKVYLTGLKCEQCHTHANAYEKSHPLDMLLKCDHKDHKGGIERCCYNWTWKFHTMVNERLKKVNVSEDDSYFFYRSDESVCSKNCGQIMAHQPQTKSSGEKSISLFRAILPFYPYIN